MSDLTYEDRTFARIFCERPSWSGAREVCYGRRSAGAAPARRRGAPLPQSPERASDPTATLQMVHLTHSPGRGRHSLS